MYLYKNRLEKKMPTDKKRITVHVKSVKKFFIGHKQVLMLQAAKK